MDFITVSTTPPVGYSMSLSVVGEYSIRMFRIHLFLSFLLSFFFVWNHFWNWLKWIHFGSLLSHICEYFEQILWIIGCFSVSDFIADKLMRVGQMLVLVVSDRHHDGTKTFCRHFEKKTQDQTRYTYSIVWMKSSSSTLLQNTGEEKTESVIRRVC